VLFVILLLLFLSELFFILSLKRPRLKYNNILVLTGPRKRPRLKNNNNNNNNNSLNRPTVKKRASPIVHSNVAKIESHLTCHSSTSTMLRLYSGLVLPCFLFFVIFPLFFSIFVAWFLCFYAWFLCFPSIFSIYFSQLYQQPTGPTYKPWYVLCVYVLSPFD